MQGNGSEEGIDDVVADAAGVARSEPDVPRLSPLHSPRALHLPVVRSHAHRYCRVVGMLPALVQHPAHVGSPIARINSHNCRRPPQRSHQHLTAILKD